LLLYELSNTFPKNQFNNSQDMLM